MESYRQSVNPDDVSTLAEFGEQTDGTKLSYLTMKTGVCFYVQGAYDEIHSQLLEEDGSILQLPNEMRWGLIHTLSKISSSSYEADGVKGYVCLYCGEKSMDGVSAPSHAENCKVWELMHELGNLENGYAHVLNLKDEESQ
jgi:hypothetical protein